MKEENNISNIELFHVHIPKTAGTSLNASLELAYGDAFSNHDAARMRTDPSVRVAAAHTKFLSARKQFPNARFITVLREPVSRFKSTLRHLYARRNSPNYSDIGPLISKLIDADGYVDPKEETIFDKKFLQRFDNLMVRYLTLEPVADRVADSHLAAAEDALLCFDKILRQDRFTADVVDLFDLLGFSDVAPTKTNQAKSQIPLWDTLPAIFEQFLCSDIALYDRAITQVR